MAEPIPSAEQERERTPIEVDELLVNDIDALLRDGQRGMVLNLVADLHPADLARLIRHLPEDTAASLFNWLPDEQAGAVLPEMESARRADLLDDWETHEIVSVLDEIDTDDAADVLGDLPDDVAQAVLHRLEDAFEVQALLHYPEDSAGGLMENEFVAVPATATVGEATEELRRCAEEVDPVYAVYVHDDVGKLVGVVDLKRLLLAPSSAPISAIMAAEPMTVTPDLDQEEVARIMERYDLVTLPVVNEARRMLGRITIDDIVDVIREEAEEDLQRASGIAGDEEFSSNIFKISRGRLPWLVIGMAGAFMSGMVINTFEEGLERAVVLATFIPIVTAMGGNAAIQSAAIAVQGLVSGDLWLGEVVRRVGKELLVAVMNGVALALLIGSVVLMLGLGDPGRLALTVGTTMLCVIVLATTNGAIVPFVLKRLGADPASAMGPFVTTLNDIIGLTVYFFVASKVYL